MFLDVSAEHSIYYEERGNKHGLPCLFLHGGPGQGCKQSDADLFSPTNQRAILFDQRGAGRSHPFASLKNNQPHHHVADISLLLDHLSIDRVVLVGGSWGSLLALLYAIQEPQRVRAMVLWGIFLGTKRECDFYIRGGTASHYPDLWQRFTDIVPSEYRIDPAPYYFAKMQSEDESEAEAYSYEWAYYETAISQLVYDDKNVKSQLEQFDYRSLAILECYYNINNFFLEDGYVLDNVRRLGKIPVYLHQGRFDFVCPPQNAFKLANFIKESQLTFHVAGHSYEDSSLRAAITHTLANLCM